MWLTQLVRNHHAQQVLQLESYLNTNDLVKDQLGLDDFFSYAKFNDAWHLDIHPIFPHTYLLK